MQDETSAGAAREFALTCARRIFYRPGSVVDALIATYAALSDSEYPGCAAVVRACYERPIRISATRGVFGLRALHWPMLNLLDAADRDRRAFADAVGTAIEAARAA